MKKILRNLLTLAVRYALPYWVLTILIGFSWKQTGVLLLFANWVYDYIQHFQRLPPGHTGADKKFAPFSVVVIPNVFNIAQDFEFVEPTGESWKEIRAAIDGLPQVSWNIWSGKFITVLFLTEELIYNKERSIFATGEIHVSVGLEPIIIKDETFGLPGFSPYLTVRASKAIGCMLKITLLDRYWERIKRKEVFTTIPKTSVSVDSMCGTVDVILAMVPPEEFSAYVGGPEHNGDENDLRGRKQARAFWGWKGKSYEDMYGAETDADHSNSIENRYCAVNHSYL